MLTEYEARKLQEDMRRELNGSPAFLLSSLAGLLIVLALGLIGSTTNLDPDSGQGSQGAAERRDRPSAAEVTEQSDDGNQAGLLPEHSLKALYRTCSREAIRRQLGSGEVASCSIVYETLLRRSFGGDFMALLAWSRTQRDDAIAEGLEETISSRNVQALQP